jgi:hypothetical protein
MISAILQNPVSVAINFSLKMAEYKTGVFDLDCTYKINKGMLVTGYGYDEDLDVKYWKLKNTLGDKWGQEGGYIRIRRD